MLLPLATTNIDRHNLTPRVSGSHLTVFTPYVKVVQTLQEVGTRHDLPSLVIRHLGRVHIDVADGIVLGRIRVVRFIGIVTVIGDGQQRRCCCCFFFRFGLLLRQGAK